MQDALLKIKTILTTILNHIIMFYIFYMCSTTNNKYQPNVQTSSSFNVLLFINYKTITEFRK